MPAKAPETPSVVTEQLAALGARIRAQLKALRVSATALAEAAGMSRVSVHRIEQGEPSVTMGAYLNVLAALGMTFSATAMGDEPSENTADDKACWLPARVWQPNAMALHQTRVESPVAATSLIPIVQDLNLYCPSVKRHP